MNSYIGKNILYKNKKPPLFSFVIKLVLFLLFLAGLNFINKFFYFVFIAFAMCVFFKKESIKFTDNTIWFVFFSLSLMFFWDASLVSITGFLRCLTYLLCYIIGCNLFANDDSLRTIENKIRIICIVLAFAPLLHMCLNFVINVGSDEYVRNTIDYWTGEKLAATGQASLASMAVAVAFSVVLSRYKNKYKIFAFVALVLIFSYNLILAGRTLFFMMIIVAFVATFYYIKNFSTFSKLFKVCFWISLVILLIIIAYKFDLFGIRTEFEESNFYYRFFEQKNHIEFGEDSRSLLKKSYLKYLLDYPWGGGKIHEAVGSYAHDLYLDTYDEAGAFAFAFISIISVGSIIKLIKVLKNKFIEFETKQMLLCLYVVIHLEFFLEPILAGVPWFLALFCIIYGMVSYLSNISVKEEGV